MDCPKRTKKKPITPPGPHLSKDERRKLQKAAYQGRVKADPVRHTEMKRKNAERKREARKEAKLMATPEQKVAEKESNRLRQAVFRERKKKEKAAAEPAVPNGAPKKIPATRAETKNQDERRGKNRLAQQKRRANMTAQKRRQERERNRTYARERRISNSACSRDTFNTQDSNLSKPLNHLKMEEEEIYYYRLQ